MARCNETGSRILPMQNPHEVTNPGMQRCKNVVREQENQTPVQRSDGNATHNLDTIKTGPATTQKVALPQSRLMLNARGEKGDSGLHDHESSLTILQSMWVMLLH